ncbi:cryptochrome/photolyase family protein [Legionella pneumophila]|nr:cryptochrome/photolyase family protein [Legionella pneumophila]
MTTLCFILGDQLNETIASLAAINKQKDIVFLCEVAEETSYVPHHRKKSRSYFRQCVILRNN